MNDGILTIIVQIEEDLPIENNNYLHRLQSVVLCAVLLLESGKGCS